MTTEERLRDIARRGGVSPEGALRCIVDREWEQRPAAEPDPTPGALLRRPAVERLTGLARASIYRLMGEGAFPVPVRLGARAVAWREAEIAEWSASRSRAKYGAESLIMSRVSLIRKGGCNGGGTSRIWFM